MTIGISKEDLIEKFSTLYWQSSDCNELLMKLLNECKELDPWLSIENAPKDKVIWLFADGGKYLGNWEAGGVGDGIGYWVTIPFCNKLLPKLWKELPEDPKE